MVNSIIGTEPYKVTHTNGRHTFFGDEPVSLGGGDTAPSPDELLEAALATCTLVTLRMYTTHKEWKVGTISVSVALQRDKEITIITRTLGFEGAITEEQKTRLAQVAKACPVSKTLSGSSEMLVTVQ
jgi:putative redox protein